MDLSEQWADVIGHIAWPVTTLIALAIFYSPLSKLVETLGRRITRLSAFNVKIELGRLSQAGGLGATIEGLRDVVITESGLATIIAGVMRAGSADYVMVGIGSAGAKNWLTSRLFVLSALLGRSRAVRCMVFLGEGNRFVGAATPRDVRSALGAHFLVYELAFARAYGELGSKDQNIFRGGMTETLIKSLTETFFRTEALARSVVPNPDIGWVKIERTAPQPTTWEFADWVTEGNIKDILGERLMLGYVVANVGPANQQTARSIVTQRGSFVALINGSGMFQDLCDRNVVLESAAREAVQQMVEADDAVPARKARRKV
jgi:hypothetical protein